jgi:hypothetical protein
MQNWKRYEKDMFVIDGRDVWDLIGYKIMILAIN